MNPEGASGTPAPSRPAFPQRGPGAGRTMPRVGGPVRAPALANPNLGRDLRHIGIVTAALVVLLIVLWLVLS